MASQPDYDELVATVERVDIGGKLARSKAKQQIAEKVPAAGEHFDIPEIPPGTRVYNATWEYEAQEQGFLQAVKTANEILRRQRNN